MAKIKEWFKKLEHQRQIKNIALVIVGAFLLALGTGMFLTPNITNSNLGNFEGINAGGLGGSGLIVQNLTGFPVDFTVMISSVLVFILGYFVLGKEFAMKTLLATIVYPLFLTLVIRVDFFQLPARHLYEAGVNGMPDTANVLIGGLVGGGLIGIGVGLALLGGGSTGGVDVLAFVLTKYTHIRTSVTTFIIDGTIVIIGMIVFGADYLVVGLIGIISALICAATINFVFSGKSDIYDAKIISSEWEKINAYIQDEMGRGSTITNVEGGWKYTNYRQINVVFSRDQHASLLKAIAEIDPHAFIVINHLQNVFGEGFVDLEKQRLSRKKNNKEPTKKSESNNLKEDEKS